MSELQPFIRDLRFLQEESVKQSNRIQQLESIVSVLVRAQVKHPFEIDEVWVDNYKWDKFNESFVEIKVKSK